MKYSNVKTTKFYKKIIIIFSAVAVIIIGFILYFVIAKTVITVTQTSDENSTTFNVSIKKELIDEDKASNNYLTGYLIKTVISGSQEYINENSGEEIEDQATGTVTIYNNWSQEQPLAATTRLLSSDGILFRIKERADIPAGGKLENVEVYADQPGLSGDIDPTKFTIPGLWAGLQEKIYAESDAAMTGGIREKRIVTQEVIYEAAESLRQYLLKQAKDELEQTEEITSNNDTISLQAMTSILLEGEASAEIGNEAQSFNTTMKISALAVVFDEQSLLNLAIKNFENELAEDESVVGYDDSTITYSVTEFNFDDQTASLQVTLTANTLPGLSDPIFDRENITRKNEQEIKSYFSNFDSIQDVSVKFSPFWVSKTPGLKNQIKIKLQ